MNRLQHMLAVLGIASPELDLVPDFGRYVGRLMAFGLITLTQARDILGGVHEGAVFQTIRGERDPWGDDIEKKPRRTLDELMMLYGGSLAEAEERLRSRFAKLGYPAAGTFLPAATPMTVPTQASPDAPSKFQFLLESARTLGSILPLLRHLASDACTPEDRASLRNLLGEDGMFELSNLVNQLCGERARNTGR
ncbi:MAG TPA: hypothetical protein VFT16_03570 [Candidatus Saccharimonadales bacterium]|nr:hypothetical protein [Candidatus Saccharimonadales bacterium]